MVRERTNRGIPDHEAILVLARAVRNAEKRRVAEGHLALERYDEVLHSRVPAAIEYLKGVKCADDRYSEAVATALAGYADELNAGVE